MPDLQVALPVGAMAFYVYDSLMLLYDNEVIFCRIGRKWRSAQGSDVVLFGKRLTAPAFMAPWALMLRASWSATKDPPSTSVPAPEQMASLDAALLPIRVLCTLMLFLMVVGLPAAALSEAAPLAMLSVFAGYYLIVIASLALLFTARKKLQLNRKTLLMMSVDALACAPFAANLVRKVTMQVQPVTDALAFSQAHCDKAADQHLRTQVLQRVDHLLAATEENNEAASELRVLATSLRPKTGDQ